MNETLKISSDDLKLYTLSNSQGTSIEILNLGATVFNLYVKNKYGDSINVCVGPQCKEDYLLPEFVEENRCFGSSVGRYAGRISNGKFSLNGEVHHLYKENGIHLHGGKFGFQHKLWHLESLDKEHNSIRLSCTSPSGEEGYPGKVKLQVIYTLTSENALEVEYFAESSEPTIINITNHTYFNLNEKGSISDHVLEVNAANILDVDEKLQPTGDYIFLKGNSKNFSIPKEIGKQELDDTYILEKTGEFSAVLISPTSGIKMQVETNQPALVIYIPEQLPEKWKYKSRLCNFPSICIETQNFPDAPNHNNFPSSILNPGEVYKNSSSFKFSIISREL